MRRCALAIALSLHGLLALAQPTAFSAGDLIPEAWQHTPLPKVERATRFEIVRDDAMRVLQASAEGSASTLTHGLDIDPAQTPLLRWRWKVSKAVPGSDLRSKERDDYAARVYVFFDYDTRRLPLGERMAFAAGRMLYGEQLPAAALCYVWGTAQPPGTIAPNAYTDRLRMIVLRSGDELAGQWVEENRDVAADFEAAFGEPAPRITGIAVGADTDNTGASVFTRFGDFSFEGLQ